MAKGHTAARVTALCAALSLMACLAGTRAHADRYDDAVDHSGRSAADVKRDTRDHPAEILRLTGIKEGMQVADVLGADGYYSELLSLIVGPKGHVILLNNKQFDQWSADDRKPRFEGNRLPTVEHRVVDLDQMNLPADSLDAILLIKVYHDLYWIDPTKKDWPGVNTPVVLDQLVHALKRGGTLLIVDHAAKPRTGNANASDLHRIDEIFARKDFEKRGLHLVATSNLLRDTDDKRDKISYKPPMLGHTDRFVLVFKK